MAEICVYFVNNQKARLPMASTVFVRDILGIDGDVTDALEAGTVFVNWAQVCYFRKKEAENDSE